MIVALSLAPHLATALPYKDGILVVGDREFFVGETANSYGESAWSFNVRHAPWLEDLLDNDPVLFDQGIRFFRSGVPATELVGSAPLQLRENEKWEDDPIYMAAGYEIVTFGDLDMDVYPLNSPINYSVSCTRGGPEPGDLSICDVRAAYPYGTNVVLISREYFPDQMPEASRFFEVIASRMIEIAVCLDVTDQSEADRPKNEAEIFDENPDLSDCSILAVS